MLQFAKGSFMSTPQTLQETDEANIDTEFILDVNNENMSKLISINLHQMKPDNRKRSKVVGRTTKMALPIMPENSQKLKTV